MRVLVVDDSSLFRKVVREALAGVPGLDVVGTAANGRIALEKIAQLKPDLVTLDVEMPELDGLAVLETLGRQPAPPGVIMLSALTRQGALQTSKALGKGAFDFVLKPRGRTPEESLAALEEQLLPKVEAYRKSRHRLSGADSGRGIVRAASRPAAARVGPATDPGGQRIRVVVVGASTGGPAALSRWLPALPSDFPVPVLVVQHMPPMFTRYLADDLNERCHLQVKEAADGDRLQRGAIFIAPGGKQMKIATGGPQGAIAVTDDPPERSCRPSVDYLFRSAAFSHGGATLAVVMTGMGNDGTQGCRLLKRKGATILAQDEASCVVYGMPRQVIEAGLAETVCPLDKLAETVTARVSRRTVSCR